jgi:hypothetical protein
MAASYSDLVNYDFDHNTTGIYNKRFYHKSTALYKYQIVGKKLFILDWGAPISPFGISKRDYYKQQQVFLSRNSSVPFITVYEFKDSFYVR